VTGNTRQDEAAAKGVRTVVLSGRLGVKAEQDLTAMLLREIDASEGRVLLDLAAVDFVSSSGLRALMLAYKRANAKSCKVAMVHVQPGVYKIFKLTASESLFHVFENLGEAQAWLAQQDGPSAPSQ
jgi:anti-anti-sigma factor